MKKGKVYPHLHKVKPKSCVLCSMSFIPRRKEQKYCGKKCWNKRATIINQCLFCSNDVKTQKSVDKKYCDIVCRNKDYRQRFSGDKSHLWEGGKTKKSKILKTSSEYREWRAKVFTRDGYKCVICGKKDRTIEADHIKAQSEYPELIYDLDNGRTLCHECHKQTDNYGWKLRKYHKK